MLNSDSTFKVITWHVELICSNLNLDWPNVIVEYLILICGEERESEQTAIILVEPVLTEVWSRF